MHVSAKCAILFATLLCSFSIFGSETFIKDLLSGDLLENDIVKKYALPVTVGVTALIGGAAIAHVVACYKSRNCLRALTGSYESGLKKILEKDEIPNDWNDQLKSKHRYRTKKREWSTLKEENEKLSMQVSHFEDLQKNHQSLKKDYKHISMHNLELLSQIACLRRQKETVLDGPMDDGEIRGRTLFIKSGDGVGSSSLISDHLEKRSSSVPPIHLSSFASLPAPITRGDEQGEKIEENSKIFESALKTLCGNDVSDSESTSSDLSTDTTEDVLRQAERFEAECAEILNEDDEKIVSLYEQGLRRQAARGLNVALKHLGCDIEEQDVISVRRMAAQNSTDRYWQKLFVEELQEHCVAKKIYEDEKEKLICKLKLAKKVIVDGWDLIPSDDPDYFINENQASVDAEDLFIKDVFAYVCSDIESFAFDQQDGISRFTRVIERVDALKKLFDEKN